MNDINQLSVFFMCWVFVLGLCIGSFLNVVVLRGLSGESIVFPPSKCPKCLNKLKWWMNIPVLSYLFLRGKCHYCKEPISLQYPIVELFEGIIFLLIYLKFNISLESLFYMIAASLLTVMSVCDIKESIIFDIHAYILILIGLSYNFITGGVHGFLFGLFGAISGFIFYEILARSGYLFAGHRAFGEGDSLIASGIGAFFGWKIMLLSAGISVIVMSLFAFPYLFIHSYKTGKKDTCIALSVSLFLILITYIFTRFNLSESIYSSLIFLLFIICGILWCIKLIFKDMKKNADNDESSLCLLPFGPAMAISFIIIMFFAQNLETFAKFYFS